MFSDFKYLEDPEFTSCLLAECKCTSPGGTGDCDHRTGQCICKPNVIGNNCTECAPLSFNYTSGEGCELCDCHEIGAIEPRCDLVSLLQIFQK